MTTKERIIKRLNRAFGFQIPLNAPYHHHGGRGLFAGGWSWGVSCGGWDVGSMFPMTECLRWKKWVYCRDLNEIFEYLPNNDYTDCLVEK